MKTIIELKTRIKNREFFLSQFEQQAEKRVLFVNPSLSGKYLYKSLLPYLGLRMNNRCATAVTNISDYSVREQLVGYKALDIMNDEDGEMMIQWATHIIYPFVLQPLTSAYEHIRSLNPECKILYNVDFNFYEMSDKHPLKSMFDEDFVLPLVEDNMYFSDVILTTNGGMQLYLIDKMSELVQTKYVGVLRNSMYNEIKVNYLPFLTNVKTILDNVEYDASDIIFKVPVKKEEPIVAEPEDVVVKTAKTPVVVVSKIKKKGVVKKSQPKKKAKKK